MSDASRTPQPRIIINGRFLAAVQSGVQRTARQLVVALDEDLAQNPGACRWELMHPRGADPKVQLQAIRSTQVAGLGGPLWEQVSLARRASGAVLINLANVAPLAHARSVVMFHDAQVHDWPQSYSPLFVAYYRALQPMLAARAAAILTVSRHSARRLAQHGVTRRTIEIAPNGAEQLQSVIADASILGRLGGSDRPFVLGFMSTQAHKNAALLLELFAASRADGVRLALVGDWPSGLIVGPDVIFLGRVSDAQLRALYEHALCLLFPSLTEGFGLPIGEAMSCGCPVIASDIDVFQEFWSEAALLRSANDMSAWSEAITDLSRSPARREQMSINGKAVAAGLTWRRSAAKIRAIAERIAQER